MVKIFRNGCKIRITPNIADADDVDKSAQSNDKVLAYKSASGKHEYVSGTGGVTDHGALTGLADDDHPQYTRDAEVDAIVLTHKNIAAAHHAKYTNAEAVAAVAAADNFLKNNADDTTTGIITLKGISRITNVFEQNTFNGVYSPAGKEFDVWLGALGLSLKRYSPDITGLVMFGHKARGTRAAPAVPLVHDSIYGLGCRVWDGNSWAQNIRVLGKVDGTVTGTSSPSRFCIETCPVGSQTAVERLAVDNSGKLDLKSNIIKDPKNHAASALSGTKKLIEIDIGGTPYYFEAYPTKA